LEFGKRLFYIIHQAVTKNKNIEHIIEEYRSVPLYITRDFEKIIEIKSDFEQKLVKSLDRFKQKIKTVNADRERKKQKGILKTDEIRTKRFKERLQSFVKKDMQFEYPFPDSDDNPKTKEPNLKK
jgi:exonuclease VII large subunit